MQFFRESRLLYLGVEKPHEAAQAQPSQSEESDKEQAKHEERKDHAKLTYGRLKEWEKKYKDTRLASGMSVKEAVASLDEDIAAYKADIKADTSPAEKQRIESFICILIERKGDSVETSIREQLSNRCDDVLAGRKTLSVQAELALYQEALEQNAFFGRNVQEEWPSKAYDRMKELEAKKTIPPQLLEKANALKQSLGTVVLRQSN